MPPRLAGAALQLLVPLALSAAGFPDVTVDADEGSISLLIPLRATEAEVRSAKDIAAAIPGVQEVTAHQRDS